MTAIQRKNLEALKRRNPALAERVQAFPPSGRYFAVTEGLASPDLGWLEGGETKTFYRAANPEASASARVSAMVFGNPVNIIFTGLGLGYEVKAVYQRLTPDTENILLIEEDIGLFRLLLETSDISAIIADKRTHLLVGEEEGALFGFFTAFLQKDFGYSKVLSTRAVEGGPGFAHSGDYYRAALRHYRDAALDLLFMVGNSTHDSFVGMMHLLKNLETIARVPGVDRLFGKFSGKPAIIVAAGPSLDKNVSLLNEVGDRAVIFSVDATLINLVKRGIRPHFVTVLERVELSPKLFSTLTDEEVKDTVQVSVPVVVPEVYNVYRGPKALMYRPVSMFDWLEKEKGTLKTGNSCANMAFKLAEAFGCDPIILIGQDLAYGTGGESHAGITPWGKRQAGLSAENPNVFQVKGNVEEWVTTNAIWNNFRLSYERDVAGFKGKVINATEGGAFIPGTEVTTFREAIGRCLKKPFSPAITAKELLKEASGEEAAAYLGWLKGDKVPKTVREIERRLLILKELSAEAKAELLKPGGHHQEVINRILVAYSGFAGNRIVEEVLLSVVQPAIVMAMVEHHALGETCTGAKLARKRLEFHAGMVEKLSAMVERILALFTSLEEAVAEDLFNVNISLLDRQNPALAERMRKFVPSGRVKRVKDPSGGWRLAGEGQTEAPFKGFGETAPAALTVFLGLDVSQAFLAALGGQNPAQKCVALVEPDLDVFYHFLHAVNLASLSITARIWFQVGEVTGETLITAENSPGSHIMAASSSVLWLCRDEGKRCDTAREAISDRLNSGMETILKAEPLKTLAALFGSLDTLMGLSGASALAGYFKGREALVVLDDASWPELAEIVEAKGAGRLLIASVVAGLRLLQRGVTPHVIVGVNEKYLSEAASARWLFKPLLLVPATMPALDISGYGGPVAVLENFPAFFGWLKGKRPPHFKGAGGSGLMALEAASLLGAEPVYAVGGGQPSSAWNPRMPPYLVRHQSLLLKRSLKGAVKVEPLEKLQELLRNPEDHAPPDVAALSTLLGPPSATQRQSDAAELKRVKIPALIEALARASALLDAERKRLEEGGELPADSADTWFAREWLSEREAGWLALWIATPLWLSHCYRENRTPISTGAQRLKLHLEFLSALRSELARAEEIVRKAAENV